MVVSFYEPLALCLQIRTQTLGQTNVCTQSIRVLTGPAYMTDLQCRVESKKLKKRVL